MQLLPVKQAKEAVDSQTQQDIIRATEAKQELKSVLSELAKAEASFKLALANQSLRQMNEEATHGETIKRLVEEIDRLEKLRANLLIPIDAEREQVHTMYIQAEELRQINIDTERELEEQRDLLESKLDDASERLEVIATKEAELKQRESGIHQQEVMTKKVVEELTDKLTAKVNQCDAREKELNEKARKLSFIELSLESKQNDIVGQYQFIESEKTRLIDREQTLERNIQRNEQRKARPKSRPNSHRG